ncbi:GNAT family N-acetyltransferase [uncultured Metabacillus sp.]|uniref:GNAT family N-acetyltransferase n=1 Tax=uncultured Metabacillus sp. TaxID=2860135 RepID=UPI0026395BFE|nr:GNAT family N-acetyltransferase [uncultured Metabacillus sp.]
MYYTLQTERLFLRPYKLNDAPRAQKLAGVKELAETTFLPYPYTLEVAENWIKTHSKLIENGDAYPFAVTLESEKKLIGTMTIRVDKLHNKGELAYWIGKEYWGKGYATEVVKKVNDFGFNELNLNRIWAPIMSKNEASGRVLKKAGLTYEGTLKQDVLRWNQYEDVEIYGVLKHDYN